MTWLLYEADEGRFSVGVMLSALDGFATYGWPRKLGGPSGYFIGLSNDWLVCRIS